MNLFELSAKIGVDDSDFNEGIGKARKGFGDFSAWTIAKGQLIADAIKASGKAFLDLGKQAINSFAEYEQLVGGVETLFQGSQKSFDEFTKSIGTSWSDIAKYQKEAGLAVTGWLDTSTLESLQTKYEDMSKAMANAHNVVLENAANAYKTAGMSANEYMETVTSFSASLIQSLGGDTAKAADYADIAITDMADNANKMGSSIETLQTAYAGFAKQNYTMLDNLKLGYGGTKEEMQRLLDDAEKLSGVEYDISSFADITQAIHVMQESMGIAGATALEAGTTIEGSVNAMKGAWQNLLTGLADGNADVGELVDNLVATIVGDGTENNLGVLGNVMPAVKTALNGASKLVSELLPAIVQEIPTLIEENLPILAKAAVSIIQSLVDGISQNQALLMSTAIETIMFLADNLIMMLPQIVALGLDLIVSLANGISENVEELVPTIVDVVLQIVETLTDPGTLSSLVDAAIAIMVGLANGIIASLPVLIAQAPAIISNLVTAIIENVPKLLDAAWEVIKTLVQGLIDNFPEILAAGESILNALMDGIEALFVELYDVGLRIISEIKRGISDAWEGLTAWFNNLWDSLFGNRSVDVNVNANDNTSAPAPNANGISYVPYDGYYALLHEGERVLTAEENKSYSGGSRNTSGITIVQNIQAVPQTPAEFAASTAAYFEQARWAI